MTTLGEGNGRKEYPIYSEWEELIMVRKGNIKMIYDRELDRAELYDLQNDPGEKNDLSSQDLATANTMRSELIDWIREIEAKRPERAGIKVDDKTVENLKGLGYIR